MQEPTKRRFRVALSFPGECRPFVSKVAERLISVLGSESVFYDLNFEVELGKLNLDLILGDIYRSQSDLIAPFFCKDYKRKKWCRLEWRYIKSLIVDEDVADRIMLIRFDDTEIDGILPFDGYHVVGNRSPEQIADLILARLSGHPQPTENFKGLQEYHNLPSTSGLCFGRDDILNKLDDAWNSPSINICTLVASGGVGKTSLVKAWLLRWQEKGDHGARAIYTHSFYKQGALHGPESQEAKSTGDEFLSSALDWFGDPSPDIGSPINKAERLAALLQKTRTLLILDGLEPLQFQIDEFRGKIRDTGIQRLLRELARSNPGLCLVTTRVPVADLLEFKAGGKKSHLEIELPNLSAESGRDLLLEIGVSGEHRDIERAVGEFGGHALALTLLGYYLKNRFNGDIRRRDQIRQLVEEQDHGEHARGVMESYEELLAGKPELSLLYILGLFDRPAKEAAINAIIECSSTQSRGAGRQLWRGLKGFPDSSLVKSLLLWLGVRYRNFIQKRSRSSAFGQLVAPFHDPSGPDFDRALRTLRALRLVNSLDPQMPDVVDCHPLVRQYFGQAFRRCNHKGWQEAHSRLFEYYSSLPNDEQPASLVEMEPLYASVAHGCQAGRYTEAGLTYHRRMLRGAVYSCNYLGALQSDLALLTYFFEKTWIRPASDLTKLEKSLLQHWSGILLLTLGRWDEGIRPTTDAIEAAKNSKSWWMAATGSYYLGLAHMTLGNLAFAKISALQGIKFGHSSQDPLWLIGPYSTLGRCLHKMGALQEAKAAFQSAEQAMRQITPDIRMLHSVWSYWYCDLLLDLGDFQIARERGEHALQCAPAQFKSSQGLLLDMAVSELTIARASLMLEWKDAASDFSDSKEYFERAFETLRSVNHQWLMPEALLGRSEYHRLRGAYVEAAADIDETRLLASRDGLKIHEADWQIESMLLSLIQKETGQTHEHLNDLENYVTRMSYHRRDVQILLLRAKLSHIQRQSGDVQKYLSIAKQKANSTGSHQWLVEATEKELAS